MTQDNLNDLSLIGVRGWLYQFLRDRERFDAERDRRMDERFQALDKALTLQAAEYERRLHDLNGEYQRDRARQNLYVTVEKWEAQSEAEREARETALLRVNEKFDDYLKRYEARQRDVDLLLSAQEGAAAEAKRAAEAQGRRSNRNLAVASVVLGVVVFVSNLVIGFVT